MRRPWRTVLHITLGPDRVTLLRTGRWQGTRMVAIDRVVPAGVGDGANATELMQHALSEALAEISCRRAVAEVVLAEQWVRYFSVTPPHNLTRLDDCRLAATMRFQTLFGEPVERWQFSGDWHSEQPFLVCAMPKALQQMLTQVALTHQFTLVSIVPHFIAAWNRYRQAIAPGQWFGVVDAHGITLGVVDQKSISTVRQTRLPTGSVSADWLSAHVTREALRFGLPQPTMVQLCGDVPASWLTSSGTMICQRCDAVGDVATPEDSTAAIRLATGGSL